MRLLKIHVGTCHIAPLPGRSMTMSHNSVHAMAANGFSAGKGEHYDKYDKMSS